VSLIPCLWHDGRNKSLRNGLITWFCVDVEAFVKDEILGRFPDHKYVLFSLCQVIDQKEGHGRI